MDMYFICNNCCATTERSKKPFSLMQCAHIFCYACINEAQNQCPQCKCTKVGAVPIKDPLPHNIQEVFLPLQSHMDTLMKTIKFQATQQEILNQRFKDLDKKYEALKMRFSQCVNYNKALTKNMEDLKEARKKDQRRMILMETHYRNMVSSNDTLSVFKTPKSKNVMQYSARHNTTANYSPQDSYDSITPTKDDRILRRQCPTSEIPSISRLALTTPTNQPPINSTYSYQKYVRR